MHSPPSPTTATTGRDGYAIAAATAYGRPQAIVLGAREDE
jgi:hypothetical protein